MKRFIRTDHKRAFFREDTVSMTFFKTTQDLIKNGMKEDCERLVRAAKSNGYFITLADAANAWGEYSSGLCAVWLDIEKSVSKDIDDYLWSCIEDYFEIEE